MADRQLPTVPLPTAATGPGAPGTRLARSEEGPAGEGPGDSAEGSPSVTAHRVVGVLGGAAMLTGGLILALGLASLLGDPVRDAVLVEVERSPLGSRPSYSDAPREAAAFFARRDTVRVRMPRDMTVGDFLGLYHLETNVAARAALRDQLGAVAEDDLLREGDQVTITITVAREAP
ncbi:MAG TPA: hypothetical protein VE173_09370 [Longimicrobiales bacterium]|nr:hypothetical protein [Longimicrobiales bacterium]